MRRSLGRSPSPAQSGLAFGLLASLLASCAEDPEAPGFGLGAVEDPAPSTSSPTNPSAASTEEGPAGPASALGTTPALPTPSGSSSPSAVDSLPTAPEPSSTAPQNTDVPSASGGSGGALGGDGGSGLGGGPGGGQGGSGDAGAGSVGAPQGAAGLPATGGAGVGGAGLGGGAGAMGMPAPGFDGPIMSGSGSSGERYETALVSRNDVPFVLITNGWGPGFGSHTVSWEGTSFIIEAMEGSAGSMGQPASYPTVFCGKYSVMQVPDCGLPATIDSLTSLKTGWRWAPNGNTGEYNAAYDIWVGDGSRLQGYLMVWLRDPPGYQPAGSHNQALLGIEVANVQGTWNVWNGSVNGLPIINWVRAEGADSLEIEFDVLDFLRDADERGLSYPGTHINAVAVGFEIWEGPISNLETVDFYVDAK